MNRRKITNSGIALESGLGTICGFNAVTEAPTQIAVNERWTFLPKSNTANDYVKKTNHAEAYDVNSNFILNETTNYNNNMAVRYSIFTAPSDCYLKSVDGFVNFATKSCVEQETFRISIWSKSTTLDASTSTPIKLLFYQDFASASDSDKVLLMDGNTNTKVNDKSIVINQNDSVFISIRRLSGVACQTMYACCTMIFQYLNPISTSEIFNLPIGITDKKSKYCDVLSSPQPAFEEPQNN
jgi:ferredoxin-like protein FixX